MAENAPSGESQIGIAPTQLEETEGLVDSGEERQPIYERRLYPAAHSVMRMLHRHRDELSADSGQAQLNQDQIDAMLLDVMALADEYLITPQNSTATEQQRKRIDEFSLLQDKDGDQLADAFLSELVEEKRSVAEDEPAETPISQEIEHNIVNILSHGQVRDEFVRIFSQEKSLRKDAKTPISEVIALEGAIDTARARYRQIQNEPRSIDPQSAPLPTGVIDRNLSKYLEIIDILGRRIETKEARLDYRALGLLESSRLLKTRRQMKEFGFALTESRQALFDRISELTSAGYKIFLGGPTGTGKTSLAVFAMRQILGDENKFEVVSWSSEMTTRDLFGRPIIKSNAEGKPESNMQKGPYAHMLSGETQGIVNDEYTSGQTATQLSLKRIYQARPGEEINLPGFNGQVFTKENYMEISTGNLRSKQHQQREEMDPAIAREFVSIAVPFMDSEEAKQVLLSSFMHEAGYLPLSKRDVEMLDQLCRAAEFTQKAFEGKFSVEERQSDLYRQIEPSGAEIHLTKTFFDSGTLFRLVSGVSGRSFAEHLRVNLGREINENPHLESLAQEKEVFKRILKAYGFDVDTPQGGEFYRSISEDQASEPGFARPYILPSEMGFLTNVEKIDTDEFQEEAKSHAESAARQRVEQEITNLLSNPDIPDSVKAALSREIITTTELEQAKEIFGADFLGPEAIKTVFGPESLPTEIPAIPFSKEELEKARDLGQFLILRTDQITADKLALPATKQTLEKAPAVGWSLVSKEIIPDSVSKNYLEQTEHLIKYLQDQVFAGREMPAEYTSAMAEFEASKASIAAVIESDWKKAAEMLSGLQITKLTRQSRDEALYDLEVYHQTTSQYLLPDKWTWTSSRGSGGILVSVGPFDADGAIVGGGRPGDRDDRLGVSFSRSR